MFFKKKSHPKRSGIRKRSLASAQDTTLNFDRLEDRQLLAAVTVSNATDVTNGNTNSIAALISNNGGDGISLREATIASNNTDGADTITFAPAVFSGGAANVIRLLQGELVINETLTIDGTTAGNIVITGDANNNDLTFANEITNVTGSLSASASLLNDNSRVINFSNSAGTLALSNLTLTGGRTNSDDADGGGIFASSGDVLLTNSTVSGNSTAGSYAGGGGIYSFSGDVSLTNSTVSQNQTDGYIGYGGGIYSSSGDVTLTNSTVSGNRTLGINSDGGGIFTSTGRVTLTNSTVSGNSTIGYASEGGGILTYSGTVSLSNSTLSGNQTSGFQAFGGGINTASGTVSLTNSTVTGNRTNGGEASGGGIYVLVGSVSVSNSIVAGNIVNNRIAPDLRPSSLGALTVSNSLIGNTSGSGITASTGSGNILNQAALLGPLANNGGPTQTHAPLPGSPTINAGSNALAVNAGGGALSSDQRGDAFGRVQFGTVDIGAVEVQAPAAALTVVSTTINEGGVLERPDLLDTLTVVFSSNAAVAVEDLSLFNDSVGGTSVDLSGVGFSYDASTNTAVWDFTTRSPLAAAFYTFRLDSDIVGSNGLALDGNGDGITGGDFVAQHYVAIPGDANLDGQVNVLDDAFILVGNLGASGNVPWADGNFNGDESVDVLGDAFILVGNLGRDVRPAISASTFLTAQPERGFTQQPSIVLDSDPTNNTDDKNDAIVATDAASPLPPASNLTLAGSQTQRDEVFGSDF